MFERSSQIVQLQSSVSASLEGQGQILLILGPAGCGRTTLLRQGIFEARQAGMRMLQASCSPWEGEVAGSTVSQLLASAGVFLELTESEVPRYRDFCREILELTSEMPLVIAVDDAHYADEESMRCLVYAARRLGAARVLLMLTGRCDDERSLSPYMRELLREPRARRLTVALLSEAAIADVLSARLGTFAAERGLAARMHHLSGGNPGLLEALIDDFRNGGPGDGDFVTEQGYGAALTELLASWSPAALPIAQALATLGELGVPERVAQLAFPDQEVSAEAVARTIAAWTGAGLLHTGRFPHPAGQSAVLGTMPRDKRACLHHRAAQLLHSQGESASAVAHQLAWAQRREIWMVPVLTEAAEHELLAGRNQRASTYLALAHEASQDEAERAAILQRLTDVEWQRDPLKAECHLTSLVAAAEAGHCLPGTLPGLVRQLLWFGRRRSAATVLGILCSAEAAEPALSMETRNLHAWLTATHPQLTHLSRQPSPVPKPGGVASEPWVTGLPESDSWLALTASLCEIYVSGHVTDHAEWVKDSLRGLRPRGNSIWSGEAASIALLGLMDSGFPDTALAQCSALAAAASGGCEEERAWQAQLRALRAEALQRKGDLEGALEAARAALNLLPPQAWGTMVGLPLGTLITAATMTGQLEEAARYLAISPPKGMLTSRYGLYYLHARGRYNIAAQRAHAGLGDFLACGNLAQALGLDTASVVTWRASAAETWLRVGNHDRARRLVREQLALPGDGSDRGRGQTLRVLAALSSLQQRPSLLLKALEHLEEVGDQYEQARTLADLGHTYSKLGDSRRARTTLRRARYLAQECRAAILCDDLLAVQKLEEPPTSDDDKADHLTATERRVAHLAVLGYTNRDIAAKLYVTSSTIEQHLTKIYRKLNIKGRRDLPTDLDVTPLRQSQRVRGHAQLSLTTR